MLATSESSGSSSTSDIKRLAADICCIMMAKEGDTADRPAPGRQSSHTLVEVGLTGRGGVVRLAGGTDRSAPDRRHRPLGWIM